MQVWERRHEYLADPEHAIKSSQVFVRQSVTAGSYWRGDDALNKLRLRALSEPIEIRKVSEGALMTVIVRAVNEPSIEFGYSAPRGNEQLDLQEI
jgi:hypothetical protein